jgi:hypothetical protein
VANSETVRSPFKVFSTTRPLNAASWFQRFDMSVLNFVEDQQTSNRDCRQCPNFGGSSAHPSGAFVQAGLVKADTFNSNIVGLSVGYKF